MNASVRLSDVSYFYKNSTQGKCAVDSLSFEIPKGSFTCILGANGSGKSTLAKLLNGIFSPSSGKIERFEETVSLVFQNPDNQIVASIVEEDTAFGPENSGVESSLIVKIVESSLEKVSMSEFSKHDVNKLSGGQKQRVCIAGSLAMQSKCLVLDEPLSMLDPEGRKDVMTIIEKLRQDKCTIIMITHDLDAAKNADNLILLSEGKLARMGKPEDLFKDAKLLKQCNLLLSPALEFENYLRGMKNEN